jgi:murein DD-endopeptidase MepM/ murein hydrolase activator NlpD
MSYKEKKKDWNDAMRHYNIQQNSTALSVDYATFSVISEEKNSPIKRWSSRFMLFTGGLLAVGNIPVYSSVAHIIDTPHLARTQIKKTFRLPAAPIASYSGYSQTLDDVSSSPQQGRWALYHISAQDNLADVLARLQLKTLYKNLSQDKSIQYALHNLEKDSSLLFYKANQQVSQLIYLPKNEKAFVISRTDETFKGAWTQERVTVRRVNQSFSVKNSLFNDAAKAQIPKKIVRSIPTMFNKDINFKRDIARGDKVTVIYESIEFDGEAISSRHLLAARYDKKNTRYQRLRYRLNDKIHYLSTNGNDSELKKVAFERRPIKGRLSSPFNPNRKHPIFRTVRPHKGTDYAAARGTPIHATADGVIRFQGRKGGYGNVVDLKHADAIITRYGHMSAFNPKLHTGSQVKRGDVIGYVGSTGNSTGNHVHYEFHVNGQAVDPENIELPTIGLMSKKEQSQFRRTSKVLLNALNKRNHIANIGADFTKPNDG